MLVQKAVSLPPEPAFDDGHGQELRDEFASADKSVQTILSEIKLLVQTVTGAEIEADQPFLEVLNFAPHIMCLITSRHRSALRGGCKFIVCTFA